MSETVNSASVTLHIPGVRHDFQVLAFNGTERVSGLYALRIELVSEHPDFDMESLLGQPAFLRFGHHGEGIHGHIEEASAGDSGKRLTHYGLSLVPFLHYLQFSHDQRIFQGLTVAQIIAQVLKRHGIQPDAFAFHVQPLPPRDYCTQYGESDFAFIQRLCAEEGIAWHHRHSADRHLLVFTDDPVYLITLPATPYRPDSGMVAGHPVVRRFSLSARTRTSAVTRRDYDLNRPSLTLESRFRAEFEPPLEDYRYPLLLEGEKRGKRLARQALERYRADYELAEAASDQPTLRSGHLFELNEHPRKRCNALWLLLSVTHEGRQPQVLEETAPHGIQPGEDFARGYRNTFTAAPADVVYRPPLPARRPPLVSQTARVTGPKDEDIYCDENGRVKVEFPWDRAHFNSERSSCWVRVSSAWAGDGFGAVTVPRVGMEVVVTFLEGDPDKPLITGCVVNKVTPTPYRLPAHKTRTTLRSRSSPRTGGYHELTLEDRAGQELIYLRAQRDMERQILNDCRLEVGRDRRESIKGRSQTDVGSVLSLEAGQQVHLRAGASVVLDAGASITLKAGGHHIVIDGGGIFSSTEIETGGKTLEGEGADWRLPGMDGALAAAPASGAKAAVENELEEEEEEVELEDEAPAGITLRIGVFFDGTGNNRLNSESVAGCHARDVGLEAKAEDLQKFCETQGYDGQGGAPDNSYGNDLSNVARLHGLYRDDTKSRLAEDERMAYIPVYLEGIGTASGAEDSLYSQATGMGVQGVLARVEQSPSAILEQIELFQQANPDRKVAQVEFDIFGFSRGAAAARHFANDVFNDQKSLVATALSENSMFVEGFSWSTRSDVTINFIGIFDTAAAIAKLSSGDFSVHDAVNPGLNLYLAPDIAKKVVHLVARDERRHNFSLNKADAADIVLPGVHSDLGGGYLPRSIERVLLSKLHSSDEDVRLPLHESKAFVAAQYELRRLQDQLNLHDLPLEIRTWEKRVVQNVKGDRTRWKRVFAVVSCQREMRNELSLIYLRIMRALAVKHDVPFLSVEPDGRFALPEELVPIATKLMRFALGETRRIDLTPEEETLLVTRYIHLSANWNAARNFGSSDLDIVFINRPAEKFTRVVHPNA
ncbi:MULTISPECIES: type VI secretion system tip protein TssI/VgrG [unclassified Pseudomonas]|uniref:type VI secretion system tip protein TssI/VgrG n=1 Tax=unclassified Pseudomonas TaxID=196821 RepID=UPI000A1E0C1E|nr:MULTISPECIES: type VI secretion system tip protein TssI/VgrG [unclassified Pseudomonas]